MKRKNILFYFIYVAVLVGTDFVACRSVDTIEFENTPTVETTLTISVSPIPSLTSTPGLTLSNNITTPIGQALPPKTHVISSLNQIENIPAGYVSAIRWSEDSQKLIFVVNSEIWVYEIASGSLQEAEASQIVEPSVTPFPEIKTNIPGIVELVAVSPSGEKAIFFSSVMTTPTSPSTSNGEVQGIHRVIAEVWIWEQGDVRKLGEIEVCGGNKYMWTNDEAIVAVQVLSTPPSKCRKSIAWLFDLQNGQIRTIVPLELYGDVSYLHSFSPAQSRLLFEHQGRDADGSFVNLHVIDLITFTTTQLDTPRFSHPIGWLNDSQLLILYATERGKHEKLAIFDLQMNQLTDLFNSQQMNVLQGLDIELVTLAPNNHWLVFTLEEEPVRMSSLWLAKLDN